MKLLSLSFFYITATAFCLFVFFSVPFATYAAPQDLHGWAWSSNIGWVGMNCFDVGVCGSTNYKVTMDDSSGVLGGYAWSSSVGWILFNPDLTGAPDASGSARVDLSTGTALGWARACTVFASGCSGALKGNAARGGWDGWIKMSSGGVGPAAYGVTYNSTTGNFAGFAWGADPIGYLNFDAVSVNMPPPTLSVSLTASNPGPSLTPLTTNLRADVLGSQTGQIDYAFWWNCDNPAPTLSAAISVCGALPVDSTPGDGVCAAPSAVGTFCAGEGPFSGSHSLTVTRSYSTAGTYKPKVVVVRGTPLPLEREARTPVIATPPGAGGNPPTANAGPGHSIILNSPHGHSGAIASDPDNNLSSYTWSWVSAPGAFPVLSGNMSGSLSGGAVPVSIPSPSPRYTPTIAGDYILQLTVTDADGLQDTDTVTETAAPPSFTISCLDEDPAPEPPYGSDPCDIVVEFSPALSSLSTKATIVIDAVGFISPITFDVVDSIPATTDIDVFNGYPAGSPIALTGFREWFNGGFNTSHTENLPYDDVEFSAVVSKFAADPKLDKTFTVKLQAVGGSITKTLDLRLILKASNPEFQER